VQAEHASARAAEVLEPMIDAARTAADFIRLRANDRAGLEWRSKAPSDFVSDVDTGAERLIRESFLGSIPDARVLGEELSPDAAPDARTLFIVDPLDGTTNFLHGYPEYAVSIAAVLDGVLSAGVVLNAASGELFTATLGGGAFRDAEPIAVSSVQEPARALIGTGFPFRRHDQLPVYLRQLDAVSRATAGVRRAGSAALDLCDVACGRFEAFWELSLSPWDFSAGTIIVREAGGIVTTATGGDVPIAPSSILAGSPAMHQWLLETLTTSS
jgi:myo-inositol-1(or 4)-monophosphatase